MENQTQIQTDEIQKDNSEELKKAKKAKQTDLNGAHIVEHPKRGLPALVLELLNKNMTVQVTNNGYYLSGFYGLNKENGVGYIFFQETSDPELLAFYDSKNNKHPVRTFEDLVTLNATIWGQFFKISAEYKKPDSTWFPYMLEYGVINITPPTK